MTIIAIVMGITVFNIKNQFETLASARLKNEQLNIKLEQMNILKNNLIKEIEYSTSSAFVDSQRKQLLGLGTDNDYWLDLPEELVEAEIVREVNETKKETNFQKWLKQFTD